MKGNLGGLIKERSLLLEESVESARWEDAFVSGEGCRDGLRETPRGVSSRRKSARNRTKRKILSKMHCIAKALLREAASQGGGFGERGEGR